MNIWLFCWHPDLHIYGSHAITIHIRYHDPKTLQRQSLRQQLLLHRQASQASRYILLETTFPDVCKLQSGHITHAYGGVF